MNQLNDTSAQAPSGNPRGVAALYERPAITDFGTLAEITAGNTSGTGFDANFATDPCKGLMS